MRKYWSLYSSEFVYLEGISDNLDTTVTFYHVIIYNSC